MLNERAPRIRTDVRVMFFDTDCAAVVHNIAYLRSEEHTSELQSPCNLVCRVLLEIRTEENPRVFGEKNATKAIQAIERARSFPLSRWLYALAIPEVGKTTATDLARFHEAIEEVANSKLLQDVLAYHQAKTDKQDVKEIAERLIKSGFAESSKSKAEKQRGIVTGIGPVVPQSVLAVFTSHA